jgi:hypothetical protein
MESAAAPSRAHRDGDRGHDLFDHARVRHARHAAVRADVGRDALEGHDGDRAGLLGDACLLGVDDVHDDAAFQHLRPHKLVRAGISVRGKRRTAHSMAACAHLGQALLHRGGCSQRHC